MTPEEYVAKFGRGHASQQGDLLYSVCQSFATERDWSGLVTFFEKVLDLEAAPEVRAIVRERFKDTAPLEDGLLSAFQNAVVGAGADHNVKAIYFEYHMGGEPITGDFFLCRRYSTDPIDDWAAHFKVEGEMGSGIVEGPDLTPYLDCDYDNPVWNFELFPDYYCFARVLATIGAIIDSERYRQLPVGVATHDSSAIVHIAP